MYKSFFFLMTNTDTQYTTPIPIIITDGTLIPTVDKNGVRNVMKRTGSGPWCMGFHIGCGKFAHYYILL